MTNSRKTILDVSPSGPRHVIVRFKSLRGGSRRWQFIVDGFSDVLTKARQKRGIDWSVPKGGRSLGQGRQLKIGRKMYRRVRAAFVELEEVAASLADGSFVTNDEWLFSRPKSEGESPEEKL